LEQIYQSALEEIVSDLDDAGMRQKKVFIASTGKDVGKTTLSLGLIEFLKKHLGSCGFMKPIGQEQLIEQGFLLDKDAVLIKRHFKLQETQALSPLSIPQGFTKDYLDGKIALASLKNEILKADQQLHHYPAIVYEGTGHMGVGSIIDLSNADVARLVNAPLILVTKGGLGSSFDELILNITLCEKLNISVLGVVLNKVLIHKKEEISAYFAKALTKINIPFLGSLPYDLLLAQPTFNDLENALKAPLVHGVESRLKHVQAFRIIASNQALPEFKAYDVVIVSSSREGLIHAILQHTENTPLPIGFILCGDTPPSQWLLNELKKTPHSVLVSSLSPQEALIILSDLHTKIRHEDTAKIAEATRLFSENIDTRTLLSKL